MHQPYCTMVAQAFAATEGTGKVRFRDLLAELPSVAQISPLHFMTTDPQILLL
jgi:hypothetical protein